MALGVVGLAVGATDHLGVLGVGAVLGADAHGFAVCAGLAL